MSNIVTSPDDLIRRGDALKAITGEPNDLHYPGWYADAIKAVPGVEQKKVVIKMDATVKSLTFIPNEPSWIPVSERPPEEDGEYLVTRVHYGFLEPIRVIDVVRFCKSDGGWFPPYEVLAWMGEPEPYKEEDHV